LRADDRFSHQLGRAELCGISVRDDNLSLRCKIASSFASPSPKAAPHSKPTPRGIDFKNPFTMSKRKPKLPQTAGEPTDLVSSSVRMKTKRRAL
jgi:hypothetical protein